MPSREIQIDQQCHGYKGGHQLLASSIKLSRQDQDTIDRLSDISGPLRPNEKFAPYLTTYPLPSREFYVLARTWQDVEARRAGCVLTRSLLIRANEWAAVEDVIGLIQHLKEVDRKQLDADSFTFRCSLTSLLPQVDVSQTIELVEALFLEERQPVVVFGATQADLIVTRLLTALWPGIKRSFSVCSYALGPRMASGRPFDLIFAPKELRSRFARWEGRRIDGSGDRDRAVRHRWSVATARRLFEDPSPALSKIDTLGILAGDSSGDESKLRLALLWNDLIDQSIKSPTAVLGMLDILHSHVGGLEGSNFDVGIAVARAVHSSMTMEPTKRLAFLVPLAMKLESFPISLSLAVQLCRSLSQSSSEDIAYSLRLINQILPDSGFIRKLLFAGIGRGIASRPAEFLQGRMFSELSDEHLLCFLAVSRSFSDKLVGESTGNSDEDWIARLSAALAFPTSSFAGRAKNSVVASLSSKHQALVLRGCLKGVSGVNVIAALGMIWTKTKLSIESFDPVLLEAITGRAELLQFRKILIGLPETKCTTRLLVHSLDISSEDLAWALKERSLGVTRRVKLLLSILERADDHFLGRLSQAGDIMEAILTAVGSETLSPPQRTAFLKVFAWSNISIDKVLPVALPMLADVNEPLRVELIGQFVSKGLRFAAPGSNEHLSMLIQDIGPSVNPDYLVASAVSSESTSLRISDNIEMLNRAPSSVRREVLRYIDNLSSRLIQNHPEHLSEGACLSWAQLIADSADVNSIGQIRAAGNALSFAFSQVDPKVISLVVVSFPIVYRELKQGKDEPSLWALFFTDWDRCKTVRKEVVNSFLHSGWAPSFFLKAVLPTGDIERVLQALAKEDGGLGYLSSLRDYASDLSSHDRKQVLETIDELLSTEAQSSRSGVRSDGRKRKH